MCFYSIQASVAILNHVKLYFVTYLIHFVCQNSFNQKEDSEKVIGHMVYSWRVNFEPCLAVTHLATYDLSCRLVSRKKPQET